MIPNFSIQYLKKVMALIESKFFPQQFQFRAVKIKRKAKEINEERFSNLRLGLMLKETLARKSLYNESITGSSIY